MTRETIKQILSENITKSDVKDEIKKVLDSDELTKKVGKIIKVKLKEDPELEKYIVDITKNVITQLYKTLWTKRGFWQTSLKNRES